MTTATPVDMDEDLTATSEQEELTPEQKIALEAELNALDEPIVPPDCEFDGPGDDDDDEDDDDDL